MQDPIDNLELVWGSDMFYGFYDDPDGVHALLDCFTRLYEQYMDA